MVNKDSSKIAKIALKYGKKVPNYNKIKSCRYNKFTFNGYKKYDDRIEKLKYKFDIVVKFIFTCPFIKETVVLSINRLLIILCLITLKRIEHIIHK